MKFTQHFGLRLKQDEIDFVDIEVSKDIPLFLDPYGISTMNNAWSKKCEGNIASYFQYLVSSIKQNDKGTVRKLLDAFHEVDEIGLGYSSNHSQGRGIGPKQAKQLRTAFETSEAAQSGDVRDIADCALLIPNINRDKVSDITANIIKRNLIIFTQEQCHQHGIPMRKVAINNAFDFSSFEFRSFYAELPVIDGKPKILVPISSVRRKPEISKEKYYRDFILEYLKAEHTHAGDSLAYVLKNGRLKVRIRDLKEKYPMSVDFIYNFSKEHPQILQSYKTQLKGTAKKEGFKPKLKIQPKILTSIERINLLTVLNPGKADATNFHKISSNNLMYIFSKRVENPKIEEKVNEGRKRIDIVFDNADKKGFFHRLNSYYKIYCPKIIIECKNYGREIGNPELDQLQGRLNKRWGMFGILVCRSIENKNHMIKRCKDIMHDGEKYIIVLDDSDIAKLLNLKGKGDESGIDKILNQKYDQLIM